MTAREHGQADDVSLARDPWEEPQTVTGILREVASRVRRDPAIVVPFVVAGAVVIAADWLRVHDPLPVALPDWTGTLRIVYPLYPAGSVRATREVGAFVDLPGQWLLWAVSLELATILAVGLAGWLTIARALGVPRHPRAGIRYLTLPMAFGLLPYLAGGVDLDVGRLLVWLLAIAGVSLVVVHLFLVPGFLVAGRGFAAAVAASVRAARGRRWLLFGLVLVLALATVGLRYVPFAEQFLTWAVVAPVHAVALAAILESAVNDPE